MHVMLSVGALFSHSPRNGQRAELAHNQLSSAFRAPPFRLHSHLSYSHSWPRTPYNQRHRHHGPHCRTSPSTHTCCFVRPGDTFYHDTQFGLTFSITSCRLAEGLKIPSVKYQIITREGQEIIVSLHLWFWETKRAAH